MAELRDAITAAPIGDVVGSGQFLANIRALLNLSPAPERPGPRDPDLTGERPLPVIVPQGNPGQPADILAAASAGPDAGPAPDHVLVIGHQPQPATDAPAERMISLQVGPAPELAGSPGLITAEGEDIIGQRSGYLGGWLDSYIRFYEPLLHGTPGFSFHNDAVEDLPLWSSLNGQADSRIDTLAISGDFSAGLNLSAVPATITDLVLRNGNDYALDLDDSFVAPGRRLVVHGEDVTSGHIIFDGSAETDAAFTFYGSANADFFFGGAANDVIRGGGGADTLSGGGGSDTFAYLSASESTGAAFDVLADFDPAADRIDLPVTVTGFGPAVTSGTLSAATASADLAAALAGLGAGHAVAFTPDAGNLAGAVFLVVDGNGVAGYQEGEDYVFVLPDTPLADLSAHPAFFI